MQIDLRQLPNKDRYKLLVGTVIPRPIAFVTSQDRAGQLNAAPFSFFNLMGSDPPVVVIGVGNRDAGQPKDTAQNIRDTGEFVINIVDEALGEAMNVCGIDFPAGVCELTNAGLTTAPSVKVKVPRIAESPVSLECVHLQTLDIGKTRIVLGEAIFFHIRDELVDPTRFYVDGQALRAIGRLHGTGWYTRTRDQFQIPRISYKEWLAKNQGSGNGGNGK